MYSQLFIPLEILRPLAEIATESGYDEIDELINHILAGFVMGTLVAIDETDTPT